MSIGNLATLLSGPWAVTDRLTHRSESMEGVADPGGGGG
jgi:hypothetical protein